jgi:hypothetical protein
MEIVIKLMFQTTVGMIISNIWKNNPNVPNHQPVYDRRCGYPLLLCSLLLAPESKRLIIPHCLAISVWLSKISYTIPTIFMTKLN